MQNTKTTAIFAITLGLFATCQPAIANSVKFSEDATFPKEWRVDARQQLAEPSYQTILDNGYKCDVITSIKLDLILIGGFYVSCDSEFHYHVYRTATTPVR